MAGGRKRTGLELDWLNMTLEKRALALLAVYRQEEYATSDVLIELDEGEGAIWRQLNVTNLTKLGMQISGLREGPISTANAWLTENGFRWTDGSGKGTVHYILMVVSAPEGSDPDGSSEEIVECLAAAMGMIAFLKARVTQLEEEAAILRAKKGPVGVSPDALVLGAARHLRAMVDER